MLFKGTALETLTNVQRTELLQRGRLVSLRRQRSLSEFVELSKYWFLLVSGVLRVEAPSSEGVATTGFLKKGDVVASFSLMEGKAYPFELRAMLDSDVFALPAPDMYRAVQDNAAFALSVLAHKVERLGRLHRSIGRMNTASTEQAVGRTLYELSSLQEDGSNMVDKKITQKDIGDALGMSREQVNKVLKLLEQRGLVIRRDNGYEVGAEFSNSQLAPVESSAADRALAEQAARWRESRKKEEAELRASKGPNLDLTLD